MKITIRSPFWSDTLELDVSPSDYVELIKEKIAEKKNMGLQEILMQKLSFNSEIIFDELLTMSELGVVDGSSLYLFKLPNNVYTHGGRVARKPAGNYN